MSGKKDAHNILYMTNLSASLSALTRITIKVICNNCPTHLISAIPNKIKYDYICSNAVSLLVIKFATYKCS